VTTVVQSEPSASDAMPKSSVQPRRSTTSLPRRLRWRIIALAECRHAACAARTPAARNASDASGGSDALNAARRAAPDRAAMLSAWSDAHPDRSAVDAAIDRLESLVAIMTLLLVIVGALAGYGAARAALAAAPTGVVNVPAVLGVLVGLPTVALFVWLLATIVLPRAGAKYSLGGALDWVVRRVHALLRRGAAPTTSTASAAVIDAVRRDELSSRVVRWSFGGLTHATWCAFAVGAIIGLLVTFVVRERQFSWESTILTPAQWERGVMALGWLPTRLGVSMPDSTQIAEARFSPAEPRDFIAQDDDARRAWATLVLVSVAAYALLPRALLALFCFWRHRRVLDTLELPIDDPPLAPLLRTIDSGHDQANLRPAPMPSADAGATSRRGDRVADGATADRIDQGPPALLGIELAPPPGGWPPTTPSATTDLGLVDISRAARERVIAALEAIDRPARLIIATPLSLVPDRGVSSMIAAIVDAAGSDAVLLLSAGDQLRRRGGAEAVSRRVAQWHAVAAEIGLGADAVHELDLDTMTARSRAVLRALIDGAPLPSGSMETTPRRLDESFALILESCRSWCEQKSEDGPSMQSRAELAGGIAAMYDASGSGSTGGGHAAPRWLPRLGDGAESMTRRGAEQIATGASLETLRDAASRAQALLPDALKLRPRWIGAGGMAGALACVGVAIATGGVGAGGVLLAAPYLAGLGAIAGQLMAPSRSTATHGTSPSTDDERAEVADSLADRRAAAIGDALASAALHALLLESQGEREETISRVLESSLGSDDPPRVRDEAAARRWLDDVRHRHGLALAAEAAR